MLKKRQSRRISSRKRHNIEKKVKHRAKKQAKLLKKKETPRLPKNVLMTDEDLETLKRIKEAERSRVEEGGMQEEEMDFLFRTLVEENDVLVEVLDPRDPVGSRSPRHEEYVESKGKTLILYTPTEEIDVKGKRVGIFGQKGVGKMRLLKRLEPLCTVDKAIYRTACTQFDLLSLFRNVIPLESLFYKKMFEEFFRGREDLRIYFGIPPSEKICIKKFLKEIHSGRIGFRREGDGIALEF